MDKGAKTTGWEWLPVHMPGVAKLMRDQRQAQGNAHVNMCWRKGVVEKQPGWFFCREGPMAVGVPWPAIADVAGWQLTATQAMLFLAPPASAEGGKHGAH